MAVNSYRMLYLYVAAALLLGGLFLCLFFVQSRKRRMEDALGKVFEEHYKSRGNVTFERPTQNQVTTKNNRSATKKTRHCSACKLPFGLRHKMVSSATKECNHVFHTRCLFQALSSVVMQAKDKALMSYSSQQAFCDMLQKGMRCPRCPKPTCKLTEAEMNQIFALLFGRKWWVAEEESGTSPSSVVPRPTISSVDVPIADEMDGFETEQATCFPPID